MRTRWFVLLALVALVAAACSSGGTTTTKSESGGDAAATTTTENEEMESHEPTVFVDAPVASITVDGDPSDWATIDGLDIELEPIEEEVGKGPENRDATVKFAHDDENIYALVTVDDDYNFDPNNAHFSAAVAVMFNIDGAPHMGADDDAGENSVGMVDIWHWELDCASGEQSGGAVNPAGDGSDPGNDSVCNLDDEWATDSDNREDDNTATGENSLLGVWSHSNPVEDGEGQWYFELSRPLQTGDEQDAQFTVGDTAELAIAYWDPDFSPEGWDGDHHVQSAELGWIGVNLQG